MSVTNGQTADQNTFNNAFVSKTTDSTVAANVELADTDTTNGSTVTQVQRELNSLNSFTGKSLNSVKTDKPTWATSNFGVSTDSIVDRVSAIDIQRGAADGLATLDGTGRVPSSQLPSYVDDVLEYADLASFPVTGETSKIYVAIDTGKTYRWSGSIYVEISASDVNSVFGRTGAVVSVAGDYTASQVTNTPAGNIAAVNVQTAINELDSEKVPNTRTVSAGTGLAGGGDLSADRTISMPNVGTAGTYGSSTQVPVLTTDSQGRVSAVTNTNIYSSANDTTTGSNATLGSVSSTAVRITGALTSVDMIPAGASAQQFILINRTGGSVTINNNTGGTAANRIYTGTGSDLTFSSNAALFFEYDSTTSRWQVTGGSGGSGANTALSNLASTAVNDHIVPDVDASRNLGEAAKMWQSLYAYSAVDTGDVQSAQFQERHLDDNVGNPALDYNATDSLILKANLDDGAPRQFHYENEDSSFVVGTYAATGLSQNVNWQWPQDNGTAGGILTTDGTGITSWATTISVTGAAFSLDSDTSIALTDTTDGNSINLDSTGSNIYSGTGLPIVLDAQTYVWISNDSSYLKLPQTITAGGTTGAQTINKISGTVNFAAAATSLVVTNSKVTSSSLVFAVIRTNDTTATIKNVVPASGSFTINLTAAATAETSVGFFVLN